MQIPRRIVRVVMSAALLFAASHARAQQKSAATAKESPPVDYPAAMIGWDEDDQPMRIAAARLLCRDGDYGTALAVLPAAGDSEPALVDRVRQRVVEVARLRTLLLERAKSKKLRIAPVVGGKRRGGTVVGFTADELTLRNRSDTFNLPLSVLSAANLENELRKHKLVTKTDWQCAWLRWLAGDKPSKALRHMVSTAPETRVLRDDLALRPKDSALVAADLARILQLTPATQQAAAFDQMEWLVGVIATHRNHALFADRIAGLKQCVKALAQRAFSLTDRRCLSLTIDFEPAADGKVSIRYDGGRLPLLQDFRYDAALTKACLKNWSKLATSLHTFEAKDGVAELVGRGVYSWPIPVHGPLTMELGFQISGSGRWGLLMGAREDGAMLRVSMAGVMSLWDPKTRLSDELGKTSIVNIGQTYRLRLEFDGKGKATSYLNDQKVAVATKLGTLVRGRIALMTCCSQWLSVKWLKISGTLDMTASTELRGVFVRKILGRIKW